MMKFFETVRAGIRPRSPEQADDRSETEREPMLAVLGSFVDPERIAIDVGANAGRYTAVFARTAKRVIAFEPLPRLAEALARQYGRSRVDVFCVALSNESSVTRQLFVPHDGERSIESRASLDEHANGGFFQHSTRVDVRRLDDYALADVGIIKIDVEGLELEVLLGSEATIRRCRPTLIVEIEERHHPGHSWEIIDYVKSLGYEGRFLRNGALVSVDLFDFATMQREDHLKPAFGPPTGEYINNFVFIPSGHSGDPLHEHGDEAARADRSGR